MRITRVEYSVKRKELVGKIHVLTDVTKEVVHFSQDKKGEYGWNQWGADSKVLSFTQPTVEEICNKYLQGEL